MIPIEMLFGKQDPYPLPCGTLPISQGKHSDHGRRVSDETLNRIEEALRDLSKEGYVSTSRIRDAAHCSHSSAQIGLKCLQKRGIASRDGVRGSNHIRWKYL